MMVVGMDVHKDSSPGNKTVAAFIASINGKSDNKLNCTRYYSKCVVDPRDSLYMNALQGFMAGSSFLAFYIALK